MQKVTNFDISLERLPISCFIYEPVYQDSELIDFQITYANPAFRRDWNQIGYSDVYVGAHLRKESLMDEYSLQMMDRFMTEQKHSFVTHLIRAGLYLHMEPMTDLPDPYGGFFVTNITDYERREQNNKVVREMLLSKILVRQFDMVAFIHKGNYGVTIGDAARITKGSIFPKTRYGIYEKYLTDQVIPVLHGDEELRKSMEKALSLPEIEKQVKEREPYIVNIVIRIEGAKYHKRFYFYSANPLENFYVILKSDTTELYQEQSERNEQMKSALREAREANVAKSSFLSSMSHEIRTPMNAIIGIGNIALQEPGLSDRTREHLKKIGVSAHHMLDLINDILNMSRIESGRMVLKSEEFSRKSFLEQINTLVSSQCQDKGLEFVYDVKEGMEDYYIGDDMKLKQVLINILGNAVKFTAEGGSVTFSAEQTSRLHDHATIEFRIKDTGIGMDEKYLPKIFDAFTQEDATTTNRYGGSGLGMAITKNIVELMNGSISVTSKKGKGTEFTVTVPLRVSERSKSDEDEMHPSDFHILVIDDDPISTQHVKLVLDEVGVNSDIALSTDEGLKILEIAKARGNDYNVVFVDYKMPELDGIQLSRLIRKNDEKIIIILLTSYSWLEIEEEAVAAGVDSFITKPLLARDVMHELRNAIDRKQGKIIEVSLEDLTGKRILLAEDLEINAEIMTELLRMRGMEVEVAQNGRIAVDLVENNDP
ncbi:MAG: response regulator, partial [Lachnospiraceae bacterium]|nr:response regulator [Lachnospiraceae bacterium]